MKCFNLYYNSNKLNNYPLSLNQKDEIMRQKKIIKIHPVTKKATEININDVKVVPCVLL